jgi:hypothetical protein
LYLVGPEYSIPRPRHLDLDLALGANPNFSGDESLEASFADFALYAQALSDEEIRRAATPRADG